MDFVQDRDPVNIPDTPLLASADTEIPIGTLVCGLFEDADVVDGFELLSFEFDPRIRLLQFDGNGGEVDVTTRLIPRDRFGTVISISDDGEMIVLTSSNTMFLAVRNLAVNDFSFYSFLVCDAREVVR